MCGSAADGRVRVRRGQQQQQQRWRRSWTLTRSTCHPEGGLRSTSTSITLCARGPPAREEKGPCCLVSRGPSVTVSHPPNHSLGPSCMKRMKNVWTRGHPSARTYVPCTASVMRRAEARTQRQRHTDGARAKRESREGEAAGGPLLCPWTAKRMAMCGVMDKAQAGRSASNWVPAGSKCRHKVQGSVMPPLRRRPCWWQTEHSQNRQKKKR